MEEDKKKRRCAHLFVLIFAFSFKALSYLLRAFFMAS
jgi:hypothetical protein